MLGVVMTFHLIVAAVVSLSASAEEAKSSSGESWSIIKLFSREPKHADVASCAKAIEGSQIVKGVQFQRMGNTYLLPSCRMEAYMD